MFYLTIKQLFILSLVCYGNWSKLPTKSSIIVNLLKSWSKSLTKPSKFESVLCSIGNDYALIGDASINGWLLSSSFFYIFYFCFYDEQTGPIFI